jgi:hypothetical protein
MYKSDRLAKAAFSTQTEQNAYCSAVRLKFAINALVISWVLEDFQGPINTFLKAESAIAD